MAVSKNRETPQNGWFVVENPHFNGWFGGVSLFLETPLWEKNTVSPWNFNSKKDIVWPVGLSPVKTFDEAFKLFTVATNGINSAGENSFSESTPRPVVRWQLKGWFFVFSPLSTWVLGVSWSNLRVAYFSNGLGKNQQQTTFFGSKRKISPATCSKNFDVFTQQRRVWSRPVKASNWRGDLLVRDLDGFPHGLVGVIFVLGGRWWFQFDRNKNGDFYKAAHRKTRWKRNKVQLITHWHYGQGYMA